MRAAPLRDKFGGLERHVIHPCPGSSRSSQLPLWVKPGQAGAARAKRGKREVLLAAPVLEEEVEEEVEELFARESLESSQ